MVLQRLLLHGVVCNEGPVFVGFLFILLCGVPYVREHGPLYVAVQVCCIPESCVSFDLRRSRSKFIGPGFKRRSEWDQ
jgi:hypothetical protein